MDRSGVAEPISYAYKVNYYFKLESRLMNVDYVTGR